MFKLFSLAMWTMASAITAGVMLMNVPAIENIWLDMARDLFTRFVFAWVFIQTGYFINKDK